MAAAPVITVWDQSPSGQRSNPVKLVLASERITVRELIERRVRAEVDAHNASLGDYFRGLVAPAEAEVALNGYRLKRRAPVDADDQCARALAAFARNGFFLLVGDRQAEELDEVLVVTPGLEVHFVKLVPLVGG